MPTAIPVSIWEQWPVVLLVLVAVFILLARFEKFIERRDTQWQGFLKEQRGIDHQALTDLVCEIKKLTEQMMGLRTDFDAHDAMEKAKLEEMSKVIRDKNPTRPRKDTA